ncbi:MAG: 5'/3'-nucleotidase SurE [Desulfobacterales bacterium]
MKIVLTNDDGIEAPGLEALFHCVLQWADIIIVAPQKAQSGIAHRVTTRAPIRVNQIGRNQYGIDGTPADCSRIALKEIASDADWLISGINAGANLGSDVYNSGTVAAAREAAILGYPAIAISQYISKDHEVDWTVTGHHAGAVLKMLVGRELAPAHFWNVNLPHPIHKNSDLTHEFCGLDTNPHNYVYHQNGDELIYKGTIHERPRDSGKDVSVCFDERKIAITRLAVGTGGLH